MTAKTKAAAKSKGGRKLAPKQQRFVKEYLIDLNATQAAIRAGYSEKTAAEQGARLLINVKVASAIEHAKQKRVERTEIDADYVLRRLVEIDQMDALDILKDDGSVKPVSEWPKTWRQFLSGYDIVHMKADDNVEAFIKKIKWPDKVKNLELMGKHVSVQAFKEKLEHTGKDGAPLYPAGLSHFYGNTGTDS